MPSSITHTYFAMDVYQKMPSYCQNKINDNLEYFKLFSQGSDPFMFNHFLIGKSAKNGAKLQRRMHTENTRKFFLTIIQLIHSNDLVSNSQVMSYLYGYICHYYLDLYTHPFIYYKSGKFRSSDKSTYKYNGLHQEIEYRIDSYFISKREMVDAKKFRIDQFIFNVDKFCSELEFLIRESIGEVYFVQNVVSFYYRSIWYMKKFFRYANYDPYGVKRNIYKFIDKISPKRMIRLDELSFYNTYQEKSSYLNLEGKKWIYPWDKTKVFTTSFLDLYEMAMKDAIAVIKEVTAMLENKKVSEKRLREIFKDLSFVTGLPCKQKVEMKYFEF